MKVLLAGIEREEDGDLLTLLQRLTGRFLGRDGQQLHLAEAELNLCIVRADGKDLLDGGQDCLRDEGGAVRPLFDPTAEHAVEGLGVQPSLTEFLLDESSSYHKRHLQSEIPTCTVWVFAPGARWHNTRLTGH